MRHANERSWEQHQGWSTGLPAYTTRHRDLCETRLSKTGANKRRGVRLFEVIRPLRYHNIDRSASKGARRCLCSDFVGINCRMSCAVCGGACRRKWRQHRWTTLPYELTRSRWQARCDRGGLLRVQQCFPNV